MDHNAILWSFEAETRRELSELKSKPNTLSAWYFKIANGFNLRRWNTRTLSEKVMHSLEDQFVALKQKANKETDSTWRTERRTCGPNRPSRKCAGRRGCRSR